ncbi:MAG: hypothetical protein HEP71_32125 [Roseivirga sp.]|nr:hypothetical protein [Roseivirga sp.]
MSITISQRELSPEEAKMLRQRLWAIGVFALISGVMFYVFFTQVGISFADGGFYAFLIFGVFFFGVLVYIISGPVRDLFKGTKQVIQGVVTDKHRYKSSKTGKGRKGSNSKPKYYLHFGDKKFYVEYKHFAAVNVGEKVELHYAQHSNVSLELVSLSGHKEPAREEEKKTLREQIFEWNEQRENLPRKELVMSHEDVRLLKKYRNKTIGFNLSFVFIGGFMCVAFTVGALLWWVMIFPSLLLLLLVFFFARGALRTQRKYRRDVDLGIKVAVKTKILDKQKHTRSGKGFLVETELGTHAVSAHTYEVLQPQEDAIVFMAKESGWLIEIQTKEISQALN